MCHSARLVSAGVRQAWAWRLPQPMVDEPMSSPESGDTPVAEGHWPLGVTPVWCLPIQTDPDTSAVQCLPPSIFKPRKSTEPRSAGPGSSAKAYSTPEGGKILNSHFSPASTSSWNLPFPARYEIRRTVKLKTLCTFFLPRRSDEIAIMPYALCHVQIQSVALQTTEPYATRPTLQSSQSCVGRVPRQVMQLAVPEMMRQISILQRSASHRGPGLQYESHLAHIR